MKNFLRKKFICAPDVRKEMVSWLKSINTHFTKSLFADVLSGFGLKIPITVVKDSINNFRFFSNGKELKLHLFTTSSDNNIGRSHFAVIKENRKEFYVIKKHYNKKSKCTAIEETVYGVTKLVDFAFERNKLTFSDILHPQKYITLKSIYFNNVKDYLSNNNLQTFECLVAKLLDSNNVKTPYETYKELKELLKDLPDLNPEIVISQGKNDFIKVSNESFVTFYSYTSNGGIYTLDSNKSWSFNNPDFHIVYKTTDENGKAIEPKVDTSALYANIMSSKKYDKELIADAQNFIKDNLEPAFRENNPKK